MRTRFLVVGCVLLAALGFTSIARAQTSWWRTYGGTSSDYGCSVQQTSDGGYIVAGWTESPGADGDLYLVKTDASGDTLWTRTYDDTVYGMGYSVQQTSDSGYIVAGFAWSLAGSDFCLIKTNTSGDVLWTRTYGGEDGGDVGYSVQQTADGGYIVAGGTNSFGAGNLDVYLVKTDAAGDTLWTRTYGGTSYDEGRSVRQTADSGYIIAGWTSSFGTGAPDSDNVYLVKANSSGDTLWTRTYGGAGDDGGTSVQQTADGGYVIAGQTRSFGAGGWDVYLIKTNASGDILWTRTFGGVGDDGGTSVQQTADGGYIVAGQTRSFGAGNLDVYLIKTDSLGNVGVVEESSKPQAKGGELAATVVRRLPRDATAFDAMGRRVVHAKPGVYFLRTTATAVPRKILLVE